MHIEYEGTGIYQALKKAVGWDWKDILKNEDINWLPQPPQYNGNFKSLFTMKGYKEFRSKVIPIVERYLDINRLIEKYSPWINDKSIVYSDEFQIVINRKFENKFNELYESIKHEIKSYKCK